MNWTGDLDGPRDQRKLPLAEEPESFREDLRRISGQP